MNQESGAFLSLLCARLSTGCYLVQLLSDAAGLRRPSLLRVLRVGWTAGALLLLAHVLLAFAYVHGGSHRAAYEQTAQRTAEVFRWNWGGGLYINYAFTAFWLGESLSRWCRPPRPLSRNAGWVLHGLFGFMFLNAAVVFGPRYWTWIFAVVVALAFVAALLRPYTGHLSRRERLKKNP